MRDMTIAYMNGSAGLARARFAFRSQPAAVLAQPASWLHVVCTDGKTGHPTRRLGEPSP